MNVLAQRDANRVLRAAFEGLVMRTLQLEPRTAAGRGARTRTCADEFNRATRSLQRRMTQSSLIVIAC